MTPLNALNHSISASYERLKDAYMDRFGIGLMLTDPGGLPLTGKPTRLSCSCGGGSDRRRRESGEQTLFWGETVINLCCNDGFAMWAVPVMQNNDITHFMVVQGVDLEAETATACQEAQAAAEALLQWALRDNLINRASIELARARAEVGKARFTALEQAKHIGGDDLRSLYVLEESALLAAIRGGDRREARAVLNRILITVYAKSGHNLDLLKSFVLELVVMMHRTAVEAGASSAQLLGANYRSLVELAGIEDEEDLAAWLRIMMEGLIDAIGDHQCYPHSLLVAKSLAYMEAQLGKNLRRADVARHVGVSPAHFAALIRERTGQSFTDLLLRLRVERAKQLLRGSQLSLSMVALECGFYDQSHFTKIFRKIVGISPGNFRSTY